MFVIEPLVVDHLTEVGQPRGPFLEGPEKFSHPESRSKISTLMITKLFYSRILNMNRSSLHIRSFGRIYTTTFLDTDGLNMALRAQKVSWAFEKRAHLPVGLIAHLVEHCTGIVEVMGSYPVQA